MKKPLNKDKLANIKQGYQRLFPAGFFVNIGGFRGKPVITYYSIIIFVLSAGASSERASSVRPKRAF